MVTTLVNGCDRGHSDLHQGDCPFCLIERLRDDLAQALAPRDFVTYRLDLPLPETIELHQEWRKRLETMQTEERALRNRIAHLSNEERLLFGPENFRAISCEKTHLTDKGPNLLSYLTGRGDLKVRPCFFWVVFEHLDHDGRVIGHWGVPSPRRNLKVPDFVRRRFMSYTIHTDHLFRPLPAWVKGEVKGSPRLQL